METFNLKAELRTETGRKLVALRAANKLPGIVYGHGFETKLILVDRAVFSKLFSSSGESTLIDLEIPGLKEPAKVLVQDTQRDVLTDKLTHVDFRAVRMDEKIEAEIRLEFVGEPSAVKELGGTLVKNIEHIKVMCLPSALVPTLHIDLSVLKTFDDKIRVSSIVVPTGMEVLTNANEAVALVAAPRTDEELAALEQQTVMDASQVEVVKAKKEADEEAAAEGEAVEGDKSAVSKPGDKSEAKKEDKKK